MTTRRLSVLVVIALAGLLPLQRTHAQSAPVAGIGERVRTYRRPDDEPHDAQLMRVSKDSLWFQDCGSCVLQGVARDDVTRVFVQRRSAAPSGRMALGVIAGIVGGAAVWLAKVGSDSRNCRDGPCGIAVVFTPVAALLGGVLGGIVVALVGDSEWMLAELPGQS